MAIKSILIALDRTAEAADVAAAAARLATPETELHLITVIRPIATLYAGANGMLGVPPQLATLDGESQQAAREELESLARDSNLQNVTVHSVLGKPSLEIRRMAEELGVELIVIGTHGRKGLGLMLGSTANAVLHGVSCDVYVVKVASE